VGKGGIKILNTGFATPKHTLSRNRVFWRILRQNQCGRLGCRRLEEPKKTKKISKNETPYPICIKFFMAVRIPNIITYTNFGHHRVSVCLFY